VNKVRGASRVGVRILLAAGLWAAPAAAYQLPDTGQSKCYQTTAPWAEIPCAGTGQDGAFSINPPNYTDNGDGTVTDSHTGLVWQQGEPGALGWGAATSYCAGLDLGSASDWRLPSVKELMGTVDYGVSFPPALVASFFPGAQASRYWSSTTYFSNADVAYYVDFNIGYSYYSVAADALRVRCVRGEQPPELNSLTDNLDGTVTDARTGLVWQQGEPGGMGWDAALSYCDGLELGGSSDWRLPNIKELESVVDFTRADPAIDVTKFPSASTSYYWSSTTLAYGPAGAWDVYFGYGGVDGHDKPTALESVRCVRGGNAGGDAAPDRFIFVDQTLIAPGALVVSNTVPVSGITTSSPIAIAGGEYAVNGGGYTDASGTVANGDQVTVRVVSSANYGTRVDATLTIGGVSDTFSVTTRGAFTRDLFVASGQDVVAGGGISRVDPQGTATSLVSGVTLGTGAVMAYDPLSQSLFYASQLSEIIWKAGLDGNTSQYVSVPAGGSVRGLACDSAGNLFVTLSTWVGCVSGPECGAVIKIAPDKHIDPVADLDFAPAARSLALDPDGKLVVVTDNSDVYKVGPAGDVSLFTVLPSVSCCGGGGIRGTALDRFGNLFVSRSINSAGAIQKVDPAGTVSTFYETRGTCPDDVTSNYGIAIDGGGSLVAANYSAYCRSESVVGIDPNGSVVPRAAGLPAQSVALAFEIVFDLTPVPFVFDDLTDAALNTLSTSNTIPVVGVPSPISVIGGEYSVNGGTYTAAAGTVEGGDQVTVRVTSAATYATTVDATLTIGGTSDTFSVTTVATPHATPDQFTFTDQTGAALFTEARSNAITVSGINVAAPISVSGGAYAVNGGAYRSDPGTVADGDQVTVRVTSAATYATAVEATLAIGGVSDIFSVTTVPPPSARVLTVLSRNPAADVPITITPDDREGLGGGATPVTRTFDNGTEVTLTAPATFGAGTLSGWSGCTSVSGPVCHVTLDRDRTVVADYSLLAITAPRDNETVFQLFAIQGTAPGGEVSGVDAVVVQVRYELFGNSFYLQKFNENTYAMVLGGDPWIAAAGKETWQVSIPPPPAPAVFWSGDYTVTARALDSDGHVLAERTSSFRYYTGPYYFYTTLSIELSLQTIMRGGTVDASGALSLPTQAEAETTVNLSGLPLSLTVTPPPQCDEPEQTYTTTTDSVGGHYSFSGLGPFECKGTYGLQTHFARTLFLEKSDSAPPNSSPRPVALFVGDAAGYAVIIEGKVPNEEGLESHNKTTNRVYQYLKERDFADENILYYNDDTGQPGVDGRPVKAALQEAIAGLGPRMNGVPAPLWVIMVDHGSPGDAATAKFHIGDEWITPADLDGWLTDLEQGVPGNPANPGLSPAARLEKRIVIVGSCYSGCFIDALKRAPSAADAGRLIISSAAPGEVSYKGPLESVGGVRSGEFFIEELFKTLVTGSNARVAFAAAAESTRLFTAQGSGLSDGGNGYGDDAVQHPLLEDDGEGSGSNFFSDGEGDGLEAARVHLGVGLTNSAANPAELVAVTPTLYLNEQTSMAVLWAEPDVYEYVDAAWIEVKAPRTAVASSQPGSNQLDLSLPRVFMSPDDAARKWRRLYGADCGSAGCFDEAGRYDIYYFTKRLGTGEVSILRQSAVYKNYAGNQAPLPFSLQHPDPGSKTRTILMLDWEASADPDWADGSDRDRDPVTYTVLIWRDETLATGGYDYVREGIRDNFLALGDDAGLVDGKTYKWQVVAVDAYGAQTPSTEIWSFRTDNFGNPTPPGFVKGCVTSAVTGARVSSPSISGVTALVSSNCYSILAPAGPVTFTVRAGEFESASVTVTVASGKSTTRNVGLTPVKHDLVVRKAGNGSGAVSGGGSYPYGTTHRVAAVPHADSLFSGWSGHCSGKNSPLDVLVDGDKTCTATFTLKNQLRVTRTGTGTGTVTGSDEAIACGDVCAQYYPPEPPVTLTLTADPDAGSTFTRWEGACSGTDAACSVTMDGSRDVTAVFTGTIEELKVTKLGAGSGDVLVAPGAFAWSGNVGTASFLYGTQVTLKAQPYAGSVFGGWTGGPCVGSAPCTLRLEEPAAVTAIFAPAASGAVAANGRILEVAGVPLTVRGVVYSPVPVGDDPQAPPHGDYFTAEHSDLYERDLAQLRQMNVNTVRVSLADGAADHADFLAKAYNGGTDPIYVIAGYELRPGRDIDPLSSTNEREQIKTEFAALVAAHKAHAAILMWAIGDALNSPAMYGAQPENLFSLIDEMAGAAHDVDPNHPVITPLADVDLATTIAAYDAVVPALDAWGVEVFRGASFGTLFSDYESASGKPLVLLGYGIDAYDTAAGSADEGDQADADEALWNEIQANHDVCAGGTIREYSDQWWRGGVADPACGTAASHDTCGVTSAAQPDGYDNPEWWGLMSVVPGAGALDAMTPRAVAGRLRDLFWSPEGTVKINGGAAYTNDPAVGLTINPLPGAQGMCISNTADCSACEAVAASKPWTLESGDGTKTVTVGFMDVWGYPTGPVASATVVLDTVAPAGGTLSGVVGSAQIGLNWAGFADDGGSGLGGYRVVFSTEGDPSTCSAGTVLYAGTETTFLHAHLTNATYHYRVCAMDRAGNLSDGAAWSGKPEAETGAPAGSIAVNAGARATKSRDVTLTLGAVDDGTPLRMCISNTKSCTAWTDFAATKAWKLPTGNGVKRVYARFRDAWGNTTPATTPYVDSIVFDTAAPVNGTLRAVPGPGTITLTWGSFTDGVSGIAGYKVVYALGRPPASCAVGTAVPGYDGVSRRYVHPGLNRVTYGYRVCALDWAGNRSTGVTRTAVPRLAP